MAQLGWEPLSISRIGDLPRDRFEDLCFLLLRREFGKDLQRVEDRLGSGNGLDAVLVRDDVVGFQIRCYDPQNAARFGKHHKEGVVDSVRKASTWSSSLRKQLSKFFLVCNIDLQPNEVPLVLGWFEQIATSYGLATEFRPQLWVYDALLRAPRTIREEFFGPSPSSIAEGVSKLSAVQIEQGNMLEAIQEQLREFAHKSQTDSLAVQRLIREAETHYSRAKEMRDSLSFKDAVDRARDAQRLLEEHWENEPLFADITYILAICLAGMGAWEEAAAQFEHAERLYRGMGKKSEALFARGNAARMRRDIADDDTGLMTFLELYDVWAQEGNLQNILASVFNVGNCYRGTHREPLAMEWYAKGLEHINAARNHLTAKELIDYMPAFLQLWGSLAETARQMGAFPSAGEAYDKVEAAISDLGELKQAPEIRHIRGQNLANRANLSIVQRRWKDALRDASEAEHLLTGFQDIRSLAIAAYNMAEALLRLGDPAGAEKAFQRAAEHFKQTGALADEADARIGRGEALEQLGLSEEAREQYALAKRLRGH